MPSTKATLRIVLIYAFVSALWILGSNWLLGLLVRDLDAVSQLSVLKGWAFVAVASAMLYWLLRRAPAGTTMLAVPASKDEPVKDHFLLSLGLASLVILPLTVGAVLYHYTLERNREVARIETIADLRTSQFSRWFQRRQAESAFLSTSTLFAEMYGRWRDGGDAVAGEQLLQRLVEYRKANGYIDVMVLDARGEIVAAEIGEPDGTPPELRAAAVRAIESGASSNTEQVAMLKLEGARIPHLAIVAPLLHTGNPARAVIALRLDPQEFLLPTLQGWPIPSVSGGSMLVRRVGDQLVGFLGRNPFPLSTPDLLAARVIRGDDPEGRAIDAKDFRDVPVLGVVRRVAGTEWYLVAKVDRAEILAESMAGAIWIMVTGLLALLTVGVSLHLLRERQELRFARLRRAEHEATAEALRLLDAVAESSTDVIFAKDRDGRYVLFNHHACLLSGKSRAEIIGRDDEALFAPSEAALIRGNDAEVMADNCVQTYEETLTTVAGEATFLATKGPLRDEDGNVIGVFGISRDITSRKRDEVAVRESEAHYRSLFANMLNGFAHCRVIFDGNTPVDWEYLIVNPAFESLTGLRNVSGHRVSKLIPGILDANPELLEAYSRVAITGQSTCFETYVEPLHIWFSVTAYRPAKGEFVAMFENVTERKEAEQALAESGEMLRAVGDSVLAHMAVLDSHGVIVEVNKAWTTFALENSNVPGVPPARTETGVNYLDVCRGAVGADSSEGALAYEGIVGVLSGEHANFTLEYPCHTLARKRWFLMTVTRLDLPSGGVVVVHTDISERVLAEQAVRLSETNFRAMVAALSEGVIVVGRDGAVQRCNPSATRILQLSEAQVRDARFLLSAHVPLRPDGTPFSLQELPARQTLATGKSQRDVDLGILLPDGQVAWLLVNSEPILEAITGNLSGVVVSFTDITERFANEQQLEKLSLAVEQSAESIVITDLEGRIEYVNEAFTRTSGYGPNEVLGRNPRVLQSGLTSAETYRSLWETLKAGKTWRGEFTNRRKNGELFAEVAHISPLRRGGRTTHFVAIKEDVTELKRLERELDQHRHHLEKLVTERTHDLLAANRALIDAEDFAKAVADNLPGGIAYWDRELRCRFANTFYQERFLVPSEAWLGRSFRDLIGEKIFRNNESQILGVLAGNPQTFERTLSSREHEERRIRIHYVPDKYGHEVRGFFVQVMDVTVDRQVEADLKHLNEALIIARDKAEQASNVKSAFLANMSHEIRTPMNAIIGLTHILQRDNRDPAQLERLGKISTATNHLLQVINDILDISKIESGKLLIEATDFALDTMLSGMFELVAERARVKGLEVRMETGALPAVLRGDPTRLSQALINLLGNAIKFTERGSIVVRGELLEETSNGMLVRFLVQDTGIGIPADKIGNLFSAFEQADSSTTRRFGGTGLGLAITRHLAKLMGGDAGVVSEIGVGSTFWFTARLSRPESAATLPSIVPGPMARALPDEEVVRRDYAGVRILLAEDNRINQEVALELLTDFGLSVDIAATGAEAVAMARGNAYELILMDVQMPDMDGIAATRAIRGLPGQGRIPIIAMTANVYSEDRAACIAAGMNDHISKPVDPKTLLSALLRWLPKRISASSSSGDAGPATEVAIKAAELRDEPSPQVGALCAGGSADVIMAASIVDLGIIDSVLEGLAKLLSAADFGAGSAFRDASPLLHSAFGDDVTALETRLRNFDYPAALREVNLLRKRNGNAEYHATAIA